MTELRGGGPRPPHRRGRFSGAGVSGAGGRRRSSPPGRRVLAPGLRLLARAFLLLPLLLAGATAAPAEAQSAETIMRRAVEAYERSVEDVEDYTVVQEVMGLATVTSHFVKREIDGHPVFVKAGEDGTGDAGPEGWGNPYRLFPALADRAHLEGTREEEGERVWALSVTDFSGLDASRMTPPQVPGEFHPERAVIHLDVDDYTIRRIFLEGRVDRDGEARDLEMDARFRDYRTVKGMPYPYELEITMKGMEAVMSPEEIEQARAQLREFREQMEQAPEDRRAMMERVLGPRLEELERMVESGEARITVRVQEMRVNEGPPEGG